LRTGDKSHEKYGAPEAAPAVTTLFDMWHHPMNPTYNSVQVPKPKMLPGNGYALIESELAKRELDDKLLSRENDILQKRMLAEDVLRRNSCDENANYVDTNNNSSSSRREILKRQIDDDIDLMASSCCGFATADDDLPRTKSE